MSDTSVAKTEQHSPWASHYNHSTNWSHSHVGDVPQNMVAGYISMPPPGQSAPWTTEEDNLLIYLKAQGLGWYEIHKRYFKTKSGNACRKRHERLTVKLRTIDWDKARIRKVMNAYDAPGLRQQLWSQIAIEVGERWKDVERVVCAPHLHTVNVWDDLGN